MPSDARSRLRLPPRARNCATPPGPGAPAQPKRCGRDAADGLCADPPGQAGGRARVDGDDPGVSIRSTRRGTTRALASRSTPSGATRRRRRPSGSCPTQGPWSRARLAACYAQLGEEGKAKALVDAVLQARPDFSIATFLTRDVLLERAEDREHLREGLIKAGFPS